MVTQKLKFVAKEKLFEMMENKEGFKLVEVLSEEDYAKGHLPAALNIPMNRLEELYPRLLPDKNEPVVVYCSSFLCTASTGAARKLQSVGYTQVLDYKGGKKDCTDARLPLTS